MKAKLELLALLAGIIFLLSQWHVYNGINKGLYIGNSETCTVGIEIVGDFGVFYNLSNCK